MAAVAAVRPYSAPTFFSAFRGGLDYARWVVVGPYANGQPFDCGWDPSLGYVAGDDDKLTLAVRRKDFFDFSATGGGAGRHYPFSAAEVRSYAYYGEGCYSACMRPSGASGVSSSFYAQSGAFDTPADAGRRVNDIHNEIDMEFIGVSPHMIQTNFFSRWKDPGANSASGNEVLHHLGFNANDLFAAYAFKWTHSYIAWYVNGRPIRIVWSHERQLPSPSYSTMRIAANAWVVNKQAEEWAGPVAGDLTQSEAKYAWMSFTEGGDCQPRTHC